MVQKPAKLMIHFSSKGKIAKAFAAASALAVAYYSVCFGTAALYALYVEREINAWTQYPDSVEYQRIETAEGFALKATQWHSMHPHYHNLLGKIHEWKAYINNGEDNESSLLKAESSYKSGIRLRPNWPDTWADLLKVQYLLNSNEIELTLHNAHANGPFTLYVHRIVADVGMLSWERLTAKSRSIVIHHLYYIFINPSESYQFKEHLRINGKLRLACALIKRKVERENIKLDGC